MLLPLWLALALSPGAVPATAAAEEPASSPGYVVVLADGTLLPALTEPVIAFGKVRFMGADQRTQTLLARQVDLVKTRQLNCLVPQRGPRGTFSVTGAAPVRSESEEAGDGGSSVAPDASPTPATAGARSAPRVTVYSATWCPHCRTLKRFLAEHGIQASVIEVDLLSEAEQARRRAEMQRLTGRVAYPTVVIGERAMAGFSPDWILQAVGG